MGKVISIKRARLKRTSAELNSLLSENDVQAQIIQALEMAGILCFRNNTGRKGHIRFGLGVGSPDIIVILKPSGRFVGLEVKKPRKDADQNQVNWGAFCIAHGGYWGVVTSAEQAVSLINQLRGSYAGQPGNKQ